MMKEALLFSGGIDSYIAWHYLDCKPDPIYVDIGHCYRNHEREAVTQLIPDTKIISNVLNLGSYEERDANIPMRNLYLAMILASQGFDRIWLIVQKDEMGIPDRSIEFFHEASFILSNLNEKAVDISTPFADMDKVQMVSWYKKQGLDVERLKKTWACFHPIDGRPCANCGACFRRFVAFTLNDVHEDWHESIYSSHVAELYRKRAETGYYPKTRSEYILKALGEGNV